MNDFHVFEIKKPEKNVLDQLLHRHLIVTHLVYKV